MEFNYGNQEFHVLMFPFLAHGHFSAFLQLSQRLAANGINISFLSSSKNICRLRSLVPENNSSGRIQLVEFELASVEGLPAGIESTTDLPSLDLMPILKDALDEFQKPFEHLLRRLSPDVVIFDIIQHWAPVVAANLSIPTVLFSSFGGVATGYVFGHCMVANQDEMTVENLIIPPPDFPSSSIKWRPFEARSKWPFETAHKEGCIRNSDRFRRCVEGCSAIAVKTCCEIEDDKYRKYLERVTGKPVFPLGPLLPHNKATQEARDSDSYCMRWLENKPPSSVVYVSFGTECILMSDEIEEIALGLEASKLHFFWVLRFPHQKIPVSACLPSGFEDRTRDRGLVWSEWAPQREILSHPCTGGFLTHCGWNSLMEAMSAGLPLIALPIQYDQAFNARLVVEELKIAVEVGRGVEDGSLQSEEICRALRMAMVEGEGKELRWRAAEMGRLFQTKILSEAKDGAQNRCVEQFIQSLKRLRGEFH